MDKSTKENSEAAVQRYSVTNTHRENSVIQYNLPNSVQA